MRARRPTWLLARPRLLISIPFGWPLGGEDGEDAGARGARAMDARGIWSTDDVLMFYRA